MGLYNQIYGPIFRIMENIMIKNMLLSLIMLPLIITTLIAEEVKSYSELSDRVKRESRYGFVLVTGNSCSWCKKFKEETLPKVKDFLTKHFIYYELNIGNPQEQDVVKAFQRSPTFKLKGIPAYYIMDNETKYINGGAGFRTHEEFLKWYNETKWKE